MTEPRHRPALTLPARWVVTGIGVVAAQVEPYARAWDALNARSLSEPGGPLWVVLGDSMSQSIGAPAYDRGWVHQAAARLERAGRSYRIVNLSRAGATTADVLERQLPALESLGTSPSVVTVLIGANDMFRSASRRRLLSRYGEILVRLPPRSVVARLPQPVPLARAVNRLIEARASTGDLVVVDVRPAARHWRGHRAPDLFHPNERGYEKIAAVFAPALLTLAYP